jgi:Insect cuticle protein
VASAQYQVGHPVAQTGVYRPSGYKPAAYKPASYAPNYEGSSDYSFSYDVNDAQTYDVKSQSEYSKNGYVAGSYSLIDADGLRRTVDYTADDYNGFQANVRREPTGSYNGYKPQGYAVAGYNGGYSGAYPRYQAGYGAGHGYGAGAGYRQGAAYGSTYGAYPRHQVAYTGHGAGYDHGARYGHAAHAY